jgi:hypothetical protein
VPTVDLGTTGLFAGIVAQLELMLAGLARGAFVARALAPWLGVLLALVGLAALAAGARWRRPAAAAGGAILGAFCGLALHPLVASRIGGVDRVTTVALGAALVGGGGLLAPFVFPFVAGALPCALLARHVPVAGSGLYGLAIGALVGGVLGLVFAETVAALVASSIGAVLLGGALLALLRAKPITAELADRPFLLLAWIAILAVAGAGFQRGRAWQAGGGSRPRRGAPPPLEA